MNYFSRKLIITTCVLLATIAFAGFALAAANFTISLPAGTSYKVGDTFQANLIVSPSEKIYTAGAKLSYPANLLKVQSFSFASNWVPVSQAGYDSIDNVSGSLIKTAGYPGGISTPITLGTATFKVLNSGQATIQFVSGSLVLNGSNANIVGTLDAAQITLASAPITPAPSGQEEPSGEKEEAEIIPQEQEEEEVITGLPEKTPAEIVAIAGLLAAIGATTSNLRNLTIVTAIALILILVIPWIIKRRKRI